jgi:hypothetical protein
MAVPERTIGLFSLTETGTDSPVTCELLTWKACPEMERPSTGIALPFFSQRMSPTRMSVY